MNNRNPNNYAKISSYTPAQLDHLARTGKVAVTVNPNSETSVYRRLAQRQIDRTFRSLAKAANKGNQPNNHPVDCNLACCQKPCTD
jgi:phage terminase Nu1 subunit (DNA packaging protein)